MGENERKDPIVRISYDEMEAWITVPMNSSNEAYTVADIMGALDKAGVNSGIDQEMVLRIVNERMYGRERLVAKGTPCVDGEDGYYEYLFNTCLDKKPTIRPDGSVDYWSIHNVELVEEGQIIATYHEPVMGQNGRSVKGKVKMAKRGRPQPPLKGKGFSKCEDNIHYRADVDGKIELTQGRVVVSQVYEIFGDADLNVGNIDFKGDVVIHGNVHSGTRICATGSVTVDGYVEGCEIRANKDITLRGGMMGGHKGIVHAKGNVIAQFVEYATVKADGFIQATSFLDCQVSSGDKVLITGKKAAIVGGKICAVRGIEADCVGNEIEHKTEIHAGVSREVLGRIMELEAEIDQTHESLDKIEEGLRRFDEISIEKDVDLKNDPRRVTLLRTKIVKQADLAAAQEEMNKLEYIVESAQGADIRVANKIYPGCRVFVNDLNVRVKDVQKHCVFTIQTGKLVMLEMYD